MMRKISLLLSVLCLVCVQALAKDFVPPNIIIIMADDMGADDVSYRGGSDFLTPNIDALAYHGKILNRLYTPPMCSPSRAALLTGLYPIHTGSQHYVISNEEPWGILENQTSMAQIFQANGYSTNLLGKWHLGMARREFTPLHNGFDYHYGYWGGYVDYYRMRCKIPNEFNMGYDFRRNFELECPANNSYVTDLFTSEAERVILENGGSKPLFLLVTHLAPHTANEDDPLQAPLEEVEKFSYIPDIRRRTFAAMVSKLDESVGRITKALDEAHMLNNSIILFYSDNGGPSVGFFNNTASNWPMRGQKNSPWEGALRVAGAIWSPLLKNRASIYQQPIYVGDWLPTLAAAAKIDLGSYKLKLDGINLWSDLVAGKTNSLPHKHKDREIVHMLDDIWQVTSYMKGQYKYIKGTTMEGQFDGVLLQRHPNVTDPRANTYGQVIRNSLVSRSLLKYDRWPLTDVRIKNLRVQSAIKCGGRGGASCDPLKEECLFNVWLDPCEKSNLARKSKYGRILREMRERMNSFRSTAVEPKIGGSSPAYDPSRHDCTWTSYLEEPETEYTLQCDYNSPPCQDSLLSTNNI